MNLENRGRPTGFGEDYLEGDFEETTAANAVQEGRDDKMHRILSELSELKNNVAATAAAPSQSPAAAPTGYASDSVMAELTRLREENLRTQNAQEISAQVTRMKEDLVRELKAIPSQDTAVLAEIRRLADRVDAIDRRDPREAASAREPREQRSEFGADSFAARPAAGAAGEQLTMKTIDDVNSKLFHLDRQLSELSVMTLANDITPITKDLQAIKLLLEGKEDRINAGDGFGDADMTDKILDELVRVQTAVEDVKKSVDDLTQEELFEEREPVVQDTLFTAKQRDQIDEVREALENGLQSLNEQIAELHADIKIYAEEGVFAPEEGAGYAVERMPAAAAPELSDKRYESLLARLDEIKAQLAADLGAAVPDASSVNAEPGVNYDKLVLDALAEVRFRLDRLEAPADAAGIAPSADRTDEVLAAFDAARESVRPADLAPVLNTFMELADRNVDFAPVMAKIDESRAQAQAEMIPLLNTVAEMKTEASVDFTPVLDAIRALPDRDDGAVIEALSAVKGALERIADKSEKSVGEEESDGIVRRLREEIRGKTDDHGDVLAAVSELSSRVESGFGSASEAGAESARRTADEIAALREGLSAAAPVKAHNEILEAVAALRRDLAAASAAEKESEAIRKQRESLWEDRLRLMIREEISRAFSALPYPAANQFAAAAAAPRSETEPAKTDAPAVREAAAAADSTVSPFAEEKEQKAQKSADKSMRVIDHAAPGGKPAPAKIPPVKKKSVKTASKPTTKIELSPADAIADQIAHKIALQQLLIAGADKVGKARTKRILACVQAEHSKEPTFEASEDSIRRNANRLVVGRLLEEAAGKATES